MQTRRELEAASAGRADAAEAAAKLQRMVAAVQAEMADAQAAADRCAPLSAAPVQRPPRPAPRPMLGAPLPDAAAWVHTLPVTDRAAGSGTVGQSGAQKRAGRAQQRYPPGLFEFLNDSGGAGRARRWPRSARRGRPPRAPPRPCAPSWTACALRRSEPRDAAAPVKLTCFAIAALRGVPALRACADRAPARCRRRGGPL